VWLRLSACRRDRRRQQRFNLLKLTPDFGEANPECAGAHCPAQQVIAVAGVESAKLSLVCASKPGLSALRSTTLRPTASRRGMPLAVVRLIGINRLPGRFVIHLAEERETNSRMFLFVVLFTSAFRSVV
jgi:hypothetical protein